MRASFPWIGESGNEIRNFQSLFFVTFTLNLVIIMLTQERLDTINKNLIQKARVNSNKLFILFWDNIWHLRKEGAKDFFASFKSFDEAESNARTLLKSLDVSAIIITNNRGELENEIKYSHSDGFVTTSLGHF